MENQLSSDRVRVVLQAKDGCFWMVTLNGLARFDGARFRAFAPAIKPEMTSQTIYSGLCRQWDRPLQAMELPDPRYSRGYNRGGLRQIVQTSTRLIVEITFHAAKTGTLCLQSRRS